MKAITGKWGDWHATTRKGERLPCLNINYLRNGVYHEGGYKPHFKKTKDHLASLRNGKAIMRRYDVSNPNKPIGYIDHVTFNVADVQMSVDGILTLRVCGTEAL